MKEQKCIICDKELRNENIFLCEEHTKDLLNKSLNDQDKIIKPDENQHCHICGEYKERTMLNYDSWLYVCNLCLDDAKKVYNVKFNT